MARVAIRISVDYTRGKVSKRRIRSSNLPNPCYFGRKKPHAFFSHHSGSSSEVNTGSTPRGRRTRRCGSSWHADDAGFITSLGRHGRLPMYIGLALLIFGLYRLVRTKSPSQPHRRRISGYQIPLPRVVEDQNGRTILDLGLFSIPMPPSSPTQRQGVLFFLPAMLQPSASRRNSNSHELSPRTRSPAPIPLEKREDLEAGSALGLGLSASSSSRISDARSLSCSRPTTPEPSPPPYHEPKRWGVWTSTDR